MDLCQQQIEQLINQLRSLAPAASDAAGALQELATAWQLHKEHGVRWWLSQKEAAELLGVSEGSVSAWVRAGIVPHVRPEGPDGRAYIPLFALWRWANGEGQERVERERARLKAAR